MSEASKISQGGVIGDTLASTVWMNVAPPRVEFRTWPWKNSSSYSAEELVRTFKSIPVLFP